MKHSRAASLTMWVATACAPRPDTEQEPPPVVDSDENTAPKIVPRIPGIYPHWTEGDRWPVQFVCDDDDPHTAEASKFWDYEVVRVSPRGEVELRALDIVGVRWTAFINRAGAMERVEYPAKTFNADWTPPVDVSILDERYPMGSCPQFDWPVFALQPDVERRFGDSGVKQTATRESDATVVRLEQHEEDRHREVRQRWEQGRPWWSSSTTECPVRRMAHRRGNREVGAWPRRPSLSRAIGTAP